METSEIVEETTQHGNPALVTKENLHYLAGWPDDEAMDYLLSNISAIAGLKVYKMQEGQRRRKYGNYVIITNYDNGKVEIIRDEKQ